MIRWQVFAPMLGFIGCAASILKLWSATPVVPGVSNTLLMWICAIVGLWAITVAINEGRRIHRRSIARKKFGELYRRGQEVMVMFHSPTEKRDHAASAWIEQTESAMRDYLDDSYIPRFDVLYPRDLDGKIQHGEIQMRMDKLDEFIHELQISS